MNNLYNKIASKNEFCALKRTASKTVRNFTSDFGGNAIPDCVSVSLDGLSIMVECGLSEPAKDQPIMSLDDDTVIEYLQRGTPVFNHSSVIYWHGEPVANIHTHGKNEKIIKPNTAKIEILNHVLYSTSVMEVLNHVMTVCKCPAIKNVSTLHIAIDGVSHIHTFLNSYVRQKPSSRFANLSTIGTWRQETRVRMKGKANLDCKRFSRRDGMYQNFKVGSARKSLVVYNKTSELQHSHKQYIKDMWDRVGIDQTGTVWRSEMRLTSQSIKEIKNFDLSKISDPLYLLQIFKTQCENFFQFVIVDGDSNISRARIVDLFQFERIKVPLLEKIPRAIVRGAYKAQMAIHNAFANILLKGYDSISSINAALQHITDNVELYHLEEWYYRKKEQWKQMYIPVHTYESWTKEPGLL
jgi:hypothetical protein